MGVEIGAGAMAQAHKDSAAHARNRLRTNWISLAGRSAKPEQNPAALNGIALGERAVLGQR
jgi:hypothetical protein